MREITQEQRPGRFILKALREAAGELIDELERIPERDALLAPDDEWNFAQIATHMARAEQRLLDYVERILARRGARLEPFDIYVSADECREPRALRSALYQFAELRQELVYRLYGLPEELWERTAEHIYRGPVALIDLLREEHLHDLEHMWQVRRHRELLQR